MNRYSYCRNNPLRYTDPTGHQSEEDEEEEDPTEWDFLIVYLFFMYGIDLGNGNVSGNDGVDSAFSGDSSGSTGLLNDSSMMVVGPGAPTVTCTEQQNDFFADLLDPVRKVADEYQFDPNYLLGLSAHESGWLNQHNRGLNNAFGLTNAGGRNLKFDSILDSVTYWGKTYGSKVSGADFYKKLRRWLAD